MKGGVTYQDMDYRKACVKAVEEALDYIEGRCDNEKLAVVQHILRRACPCNHLRINPHGGTDHCTPTCEVCGKQMPWEGKLDAVAAERAACLAIAEAVARETPDEYAGAAIEVVRRIRERSGK